MSVEQFETEVLELAVRKVRTPEGSKKYGLPIGAIITADAIEAAKANGFTTDVPEDKPGFKAGYKAAKGKFMKGTISGKATQEKSAPKPQAPKPLGLKVQKSKLTGNKHFKVGEAKYVAPNGSKLIRPTGSEGMAYVVTPDGKVHAFNEQGEIPIPKPLDAILAQKFGEGFEGDDEYAIEEFEASSASHSLSDQKIGSILTDAEGTPQFKKLADDSWEHVDLGVKLKDQDLQDLYDSGDLIPDATDDDNNAAEGAFQDTEAMNFSKMSKEEAEAALANLPEGQKLTVGDSKWTKTGPDTFTNEEGKGGTVKSLAVVKAAIKIGQDPEPEYNPLDANTKDPLDANPPKLIGDQPDEAWIKSALPGAQMDFESAAGVKTTWTKDDEGTGWINQKGGKLSQDALLNAVKNTGGEGLSIKKEGKEPKTPAVEKAAEPKTPAVEKAAEPNPYDAVETITLPTAKPKSEKAERDWSKATPDELDEGLQTGQISLKKYKETQAQQSGFKSQSTPPLTPDVMYSDSMAPLDVTAENGFVPGDYDFTTEATEDDIKNAQPGDKFLLGFSDLSAEDDGDFNVWDADSVVEKQPDGSWKNLTYPDSGDVNQEDLELEASAQSYEEQEKQIWAFKGNGQGSTPAKTSPQFGDADYFDNAEDGEVVWFKGKPYTMDAAGGWWGDAGTLGSGEMKKYYDEGQVSAEEKPYTPNLSDLGPHSDQAETLEILKHAAVGDTIHPVNSNATLTKVNSDADQIIDNFGTDGDEGGYWQSSVTGKFLKGSELAQIWSGDLMAGPSNGDLGDTPTPEPVVEDPWSPKEKETSAFKTLTEKIQDIDQASSVQEMATWLSAANPGEKVTALISGMVYEKTDKGTYKTPTAPGIELTPQEVASLYWNTEMQISELAHGVILDAPSEPEFVLTPDLQGWEVQKFLNQQPVGHVIHVTTPAKDGTYLEMTKQENGSWKSSFTGKTLSAKEAASLGGYEDGPAPATEKDDTPAKWGDPDFFDNSLAGTVVYIDGSNEPAIFDGTVWKITDENGPMIYSVGEMQEWMEDGILSDKPFSTVEPRPKAEKIQAPPKSDIQSMPLGQQVVSPDGSKYATKVDPHSWEVYYTAGKFSKAPEGLQYSKGIQDLIADGWTVSPAPKSVGGLAPGKYSNPNAKAGKMVHMVVHPDGTGTYYGADYNPYDTTANKGTKLTPAAVQKKYAAGMTYYAGTPFQKPGSEQLPEGIPAGSTEVGELEDVPVGATIFEHNPTNGIYTHKKISEDEFETTTPSGFKIPGNSYDNLQDLVADGSYEGTFYQPPAPLPEGVPEGAKEWDGNWTEWDSDTQSLYAAQTHAVKPEVYEFVATDQDGEFLTYGPGEEGSFTYHGDILEMMDQGSHTFYVGSPTKFAKKDPDAAPENLGWAAGDILDTPEAFDQVPVGTKLAYQQKSGKTSYYSTLGNGMVLTPGGNQMSVAKMSWAIGQGNVSIHELPEGAVAPAAPGTPSNPDQPVSYLFVDGDPIQALDQLASLNIGQKLEMRDAEGNHLNYVVKNDKGEWIVPDDAPKWQGLIFSNGDMADAMSKGGLYFVGTPGVSGHTTVPDKVEEPKNLLSQATILKGEVQAALDGLEAHSSFHVKYGLKDLPASNPLTKEANQEELKQLAQEKYPDLKVKPAVVQYLKDYLGVKDPEPNWEDTLMEAAPKITLGSKTPKKVGVQGMDGGEYTAVEIQDAINILEAYPGKLFKSELAKKGNPLGELDPTQLVGFDKDKLVTKQKYIDLLKTKLVNQESQPKQPLIQSFEEFEGYPVGTTVAHHTSEDGSMVQSYTKISETQWAVDDSTEAQVLDNANFKGSIEKGNLRLHKLPDVVPEYAKTPAAVKDKEKEQHDTDADDFSLTTMQSADLGTKMHWGDGNSNVAEKTADNEWTIWDADGNKINSWADEKFYDNIKNYGGWTFSDVSEDTPNFNANAPMAIIPGKYSAEGAKAFMVVHADGSGTYYPTKGDGVKLSPEKVKANYTAGMSQYHGLVKDSDLPVAPAAKKPAVKKPKVVGDIADGTYFAGNPNDPKAAVYEVSGGTAKIFKPATGLTATTGVKIGGQPTQQWADEAGFGATVDAQNMNVLGVWVGATKWVKGKDGKWTGTKLADGESVGEAQDYPPTGWGKKVSSHGMSSPVELPKSKVNTLFSTGQLTDQYGMAVLPDGYTGTATFFGAKTTVPALLNAQKWMDSPEFDAEITDSGKLQEGLKALGVNFDVHNWHKWRKDNGLTEAGFGPSKEAMKKALADVTAGVDTDIPDADTASLFEWNSLGQPVMPLELISKDVPYDKVGRGEWIKEASKHFGDGKVIGQHLAKMGQYDRGAWISAFQEGDFAKMYQLEVAAASLEGKAHVSGYLHPGFSGNQNTNKIAWAPAVEGEISALDDVPGEWSSASLQPTLAEVNNYLIKAQMQNPTYLTPQERRSWVQAHKQNQKGVVDKLSATAALRKKNGEAELSTPPAWQDNIQPAKSYDILFEGDTTPTTGWNGSKGLDYVQDNPNNADLQSLFEDKKNQGYGEQGAANQAVAAHFQAQKDAHEAELAKVFYQKSPNQKVKKGTHPIYEYDDFNGHGPLGGHYFFKPSPLGDAYRSEAEHLGHEFGWAFGFKTAGSELMTLDGKYGQLQKDLGAVGDLVNFDMSTLTSKQIADLGKEHLLDWFLDNDDTHHENIKLLQDGSLVGIDKGRAFKHFGSWQGLNPSSMNSNTQTVYSQLFQAIKGGKLSKEDVDKAYLQIQKRAQQMSKVSDQKITDMLAKGMEKRKAWDITYKINGKAVPNNLQGLTAAVLDRKNKLPEQIEEMWSKIYKDAGFGDLPEPSANDIEGVTTGLMHEDFHAQAVKAKAAGKTTMLAGAHIIGGTALMWTEKESDGSDVAMGEMYMGPKKQKELLAYFTTSAVASSDSAGPAYQFKYDTYGNDIVAAAKTINHHAVDGEYNESKIAAYEAAKAKIEADLGEWTPNLKSNTNLGGVEAYKFASGTVVSMDQLDQYKLMLDYYVPIFDKIQVAKDTKGKTGIVDPYSAVEFVKPPKKFSGLDGSTLLGLNDSYLYKDMSTGTVSKVDGSHPAVQNALAQKGGWMELAPSEVEKSDTGIQVLKNTKTFETQASYDPDTGIKKKLTSQVSSGASGQEFEIKLPTGESIYWRNSSHTGTAKGQQGKLSYKIPNADDPDALAASMERIEAQLNQLGISTEGSSHEQAELTYWREMYGVLENRNHSAPGSAQHKKAYAKMNEKVKEIGGDPNEFLENLSEQLTPDEEIAYWRGLWSEFFPGKVEKLIEEEGYLPKFDHQNLWDAEQETGKPYWMRFDVDVDEIYATGAVLAHSTGGDVDKTGAMSSGGLVGGEERIRQFGKIYTGGGYGAGSPVQDQGNGSSHQIYTRIQDADHVSANVIINPATLLRTRTYSLGSDNYGNLANRKSSSHANPLESIKKYMNAGGNETMLPHVATVLDSIELLGFANAMSRDAFIQKLKKLGITQIRGVSIEDRFVLQTGMKSAIKNMQKLWGKK